jgi:cardiolipin synthase (CMP-forming)
VTRGGRGEINSVLNYANQLTILRIIFAPCFVLLVIYGHPRLATLLFVLAGVTDGLDGLLARKLQQHTPLGSILDPIADKILIATAFVTLTIPSLPLALHIPVLLTFLAILRDLLIALFALIIHLQTGSSKFPPSFLGKCTTAIQLMAVGLCMLGNFITHLNHIFTLVANAAILFTVLSGVHYLYRSIVTMLSYRRPEVENGETRHQDS